MTMQGQIPKPIEITLEVSREEAPGVKTFLFKYDKARISYRPGQSVLVFADKGNLALRHPFSLASTPREDYLMITTKIRTDSAFKKRLDELEPGDTVDILGPGGDRFTVPENNEQQLVLLGGGIGITPFRSIIKHATETHAPYKVTLLYSNRTPEDIVYKCEWDELQTQNPNLTIIHTITRPEESKTEWKGQTGHIDANMIQRYVANYHDALFYLCGPPSLITDLSNVLTELRIAPERIRVENFRGYGD